MNDTLAPNSRRSLPSLVLPRRSLLSVVLLILSGWAVLFTFVALTVNTVGISLYMTPIMYFSFASIPAAAWLVGVAVCVGLEKVLIWLTSDPPYKSEMELEAILKTIQGCECQVVEFNDDADLEKVGEAVASFANTVGGILILGVSDDGKIIGVQDDSETLTMRLTSYLQNGFSAPVQARLGHTILPEGRIHWIEVSRQLGEPLRYNGTVYGLASTPRAMMPPREWVTR